MIDILWFRRDLRVDDNSILNYNNTSLPIFIFDTHILSKLDKDDKRVPFIFASVIKLKQELQALGLDLAIFYGSVEWVYEYISHRVPIRVIYASSDNDTYSIARDNIIAQKYNLQILKDNFLLDTNIYNTEGSPYRVFTPFYKRVLPLIQQNIYHYKYTHKQKVEFDYSGIITQDGIKPLDISTIGFYDNNIHIKDPISTINSFKHIVSSYATNRDYPILDATSHLGIHLRFGTVSIRRVFSEFLHSEVFTKELIWREFYNYIFYHFPHSKTQNFLNVDVKWQNNQEYIQRWKSASTGIPIVDAGMQELLTTGHMHNRVRMIVASFLCKDLCVDWKIGEEWFAKHLLDYESCSNIGSWQWCASTGVDAMPYFRVFNPYLQAQKFDKDGEYIKRWTKGYEMLTPKQLHNEEFLQEASLFAPYTTPMVSHKLASSRFVQMYKEIK